MRTAISDTGWHCAERPDQPGAPARRFGAQHGRGKMRGGEWHQTIQINPTAQYSVQATIVQGEIVVSARRGPFATACGLWLVLFAATTALVYNAANVHSGIWFLS